MRLYEYIRLVGFFSEGEINQLNKMCEEYSGTDYVDHPADGKKVSTVKTLNHKYFGTKLQELMETVTVWNNNIFGFDIFDLQEAINYNVYNVGDMYDWHQDGCVHGERRDTKLTVVANISDSAFEGGDLALMFGGKESIIEELRQPGTVIIFPSFQTHKVTPVTKGQRKTLSLWLDGPSWR
jgi:predicted 2-oxoglutarate/Fe(II)-dependent dioxygenase YbiX